MRVLAYTWLLTRAPALHADPVSVINALRAQGCGGAKSVAASVRYDEALDAVAQELSRGRSLAKALERAEYAAASTTSFQVTGPGGDATIQRLLAERHCAAATDARYSKIGFVQRGDESWIVLAQSLEAAPRLDRAVVAVRVLRLVNAARAAPRRCGRDRFEAAGPLESSAALDDVARRYAQELARRGKLDHRGADGSSSGERMTSAGYAWRASGENLAAGQPDADAVVAAWLDSPGHCSTLMGPQYSEMGIAFALAPPGSNPAIYWVQLFAAPR